MAAANRHPFSTTGQSTVAELMHELRNHHPDQEIVLSTEALPHGVARISVHGAYGNTPAAENTLVRYCRYLDADRAAATFDPETEPAETPTVRFEPEQPAEPRRAIVCPPVSVDGAVGGAAVLRGPWEAAVA